MSRREANHAARRRILLAGILLGALVIVGRGAQLELVEGGRWAARAEEQHADRLTLPAPRGTIYDRNGIPLAASEEMYRVAVAPRELEDAAAAARRLRDVLGLSPAEAKRAVDPRRRWVVLAGRFDGVARGRLEGMRGVYFEAVMGRMYPKGDLAREILGSVSPEGKAMSGLELELDTLLAGEPGFSVVRRDARGRPIPGTMQTVVAPVRGNDVYLTLDAGLQEIAQEALRAAVDSTQAAGGDMVLVDPRTGEVLAAATVRRDGSRQWRAVTDTYEPGSTFKPFFVATLLEEKRARLSDPVFAENGQAVIDGRTVTDTHPLGWITLREGLRESSNITMVKFSSRLPGEVQFRYLRAFGFGSPTGLRYPSESAGLLRRPAHWSRYSQGSLAIGYEVGVTPLQMAMGYAAIANGGVLMEPRLVREVRSRDGRVVASMAPRAVRRVISEPVARQIRSVLAEVVEEGTGTQAALGRFPVAGKTGTARLFRAGRYESGAYTASFAGFFPADNPQVVFLVKLDRPRGAYYGGATAAPVTRATLAAALATWKTPLDRPAGARAARPDSATAPPDSLPAPRGAAAAPPAAPGPFVFALDAGVAPGATRLVAAPSGPRPVPDVAGLPLRDAARALLAAGFRVEVAESGVAARTAPPAGALVPPGTVVRIEPGGGTQ
ncbi:MAG: PASTA domain-containing protein [Gemmatimonadetes bacterium]|nr:PASTA domain-containing protein [Gemmatimonadota bacterium]